MSDAFEDPFARFKFKKKVCPVLCSVCFGSTYLCKCFAGLVFCTAHHRAAIAESNALLIVKQEKSPDVESSPVRGAEIEPVSSPDVWQHSKPKQPTVSQPSVVLHDL